MHQSRNSSTISRRAQSSIGRTLSSALRVTITLAVIVLAAAVALGWYRQMPSLEDTRWRVLLTLLGVACGAWVLRPLVLGIRKAPAAAIIGIVAIALSQICYYVIVWAEMKSRAVLWRAWWITLVCAIAAAHLVWIRFLSIGAAGWAQNVARITNVAIVMTAVLVAAIALGRTPIPELPLPAWVGIAIPGIVSISGTIVLGVRARGRRRDRAMPAWQKLAWATVAVAGVFGIGFYSGRLTAPMPIALDSLPTALAHLSPAELEDQLNADFARLKIVATGLDELTTRTDAMHRANRAQRQAEKRDWYTPGEEDQIRAAFMSYLAYRAALLRMAATYVNFQSIPDPALRTRAFLIGAASGASVYCASLHLVKTYRDEAPARRKLNEADASCGLGPGTFERIYHAVADERNAAKIEEMGAYFAQKRDVWRNSEHSDAAEFAWLDNRITIAMTAIRASGVSPTQARLEQILRRVMDDSYTPIYAAQSVVSTLIGDTRMVNRPPFISEVQIAQMRGALRPGDILLERRNWFMSNAFLPGFWPHGALYVGDVRDLEKLNLVRRDTTGRWTSDIPAIRDRLAEFIRPAHDGAPHTIIESVSEGVTFSSLTESMAADYLAVLRPRKLTDQQKAEAIASAFAHVGKPYDFEFDFFSADKLVCTELLYRSYDGLLKFELVPIMGRNTLPALEIAKKFAGERSREDRELDFVLFLDAVPQLGAARFATEDDFVQTIHRPRGFNE